MGDLHHVEIGIVAGFGFGQSIGVVNKGTEVWLGVSMLGQVMSVLSEIGYSIADLHIQDIFQVLPQAEIRLFVLGRPLLPIHIQSGPSKVLKHGEHISCPGEGSALELRGKLLIGVLRFRFGVAGLGDGDLKERFMRSGTVKEVICEVP